MSGAAMAVGRVLSAEEVRKVEEALSQILSVVGALQRDMGRLESDLAHQTEKLAEHDRRTASISAALQRIEMQQQRQVEEAQRRRKRNAAIISFLAPLLAAAGWAADRLPLWLGGK